MDNTFPRGSKTRQLYLAGFYLMASLLTAAIFALYPGTDSNGFARSTDMIYGRAHNPYVGRVFVPTVVRIVTVATPRSVRQFLESVVEARLSSRKLVEAFRWDREYIFEYCVLHAIFVLCFIGFAYSLRRLVMTLYDFPRFVADLTPLGALLVLPLYFRYCSYVYDPAVILLFTLGILFVSTRNRPLYYVAFFLASLNKETSILLIGLFIVREWSAIGKSRLAIHVLAQALIWILIKAGLAIIFLDNPGSLIRFHLLDHNLVLYRHPTAVIYFVAVILIHLRLIAPDWGQKPIFLRHGLMVTLIPLMALAFISGFVDELRDYYEAFPFIVLLALPTVVRMFGVTASETETETSILS